MSSVSQTTVAKAGQSRVLAIPVAAFLIALLFPFVIYIGGVRLSIYRIVLLFVMPYVIFLWLSGRAGPKRFADFTIILLCAWAALSFAVVHGIRTGIEAGGILFVETFGSYLIGRCYIRTAEAFRAMVRVLFLLVAFLAPFAVIEGLTGRNLLLETASSFWSTYPRIAKDPRWGIERVQATFEHPILFGVFCGTAIGLTHMVLGRIGSTLRRVAGTAIVFFAAALSMSAGPLTGMVAQVGLITWNSVFCRLHSRWTLLAILGAVAYIVIEIGSNRSAPAVFISYFAFNEFSAYMRILIWHFGTASILEHPIFGIGFGEWARPSWMSSSIDMFWIVHGVRHGIPAMVLNLMTFFAVYLPLVFKRGLDELQSACRLGIVFSLTGFFLMGWTVHYWNATFSLFMFMLGSAMWLLDASGGKEEGRSHRRVDGHSEGETVGIAVSNRGSNGHAQSERQSNVRPPDFSTARKLRFARSGDHPKETSGQESQPIDDRQGNTDR